MEEPVRGIRSLFQKRSVPVGFVVGSDEGIGSDVV